MGYYRRAFRAFELPQYNVQKGRMRMSREKNKDANVFRLLRIARNKKVKELADELLVTPAYINAIENNERYPSDRLIRSYAHALCVDENVIKTFDSQNDQGNEFFEKALLRLLKLICQDE